MPVETFAFINSLDSSNPPQTDGLAQGDDHLRGIKATLKAQFPNLTGAVTATQAQINQLVSGIFTLAAGSSGSPSLMFVDSVTAFYKAGAGLIGFNGTLRGKGAVACGSLHMFPKAPSSLGTASTPGTMYEYLECNGALYLIADYPELAAFYGTTFGGDGVTTFGVPPMTDTGRFPRSRTGTLTVGTAQASQNKAHTHSVTGTTDSQGSHTHTATVTDPGHIHTLSRTDFVESSGTDTNQTSAGSVWGKQAVSINSATTGITVANSTAGAHTHNTTGTAASDGGTEARPESIALIFAVKS
jgi:microcystin-dependent protein